MALRRTAFAMAASGALFVALIEDRAQADPSDVTATQVGDINPGGGSSNPGCCGGNFANVNGTLFFNASDGTDTELWKSDGTTNTQVGNINPTGGSFPNQLTNVAGTLFFSANDDLYVDLYKSDGTTATQVGDINTTTGSSSPHSLTAVGGNLFFVANDGNFQGMGPVFDDYQLWVTDGTASNEFDDINPFGESGANNLTDVNGTLFFSATDTHEAAADYELFKSNGGTVTKISNSFPPGNFLDTAANVNGTLFFSAFDGFEYDLWKSDGTTVTLVDDVTPVDVLENFTDVNGTLFFTAGEPGTNTELWKSDGTTVTQVGDINPPGAPGGGDSGPQNLTNVNGTLFFTAFDGTDRELWKSDGTTNTEVSDINLAGGGNGDSSNPTELTDVNGTVFFSASDGTLTELYMSDGTTVTQVGDTNPDGPFFPEKLTDVNGTLFFSAFDGTDTELYKTIATPTRLSINDVTVNEDAGTASLTVTRSGDTSGTSSVGYATADDTATSGDYGTASDDDGTSTPPLEFDAGETTRTISVPITDDATEETAEDFFVDLSGATNATIFDGRGKVTIAASDPPPSLSIGDVTVNENAGTAALTVTRSGNTSGTSSASYATADGSATSIGNDFGAPTDDDGTPTSPVTFSAGVTTRTISVPITDDMTDENDENFVVDLSSPSNATISDSQGQVTIQDNDAPPPPANDAFLSAQNLGSVFSASVNGTNVGASKEGGEPNHAEDEGGASVWYRWTAPSNGDTFINTCDSTPLDTLLAVYTGTAVNSLSLPVAFSDDEPACGGNGRQSSVIFTATAGTTYRIAVDGFNNGSGAATGPITVELLHSTALIPPVVTPPPAASTPPTTTPAGPTGQRAAALKKCKKKKGRARGNCKKNANKLPV